MGMHSCRDNGSYINRLIGFTNMFRVSIASLIQLPNFVAWEGEVAYGSVNTATLVIPSFLHEEMTRHAISPRFAINTLLILGIPELFVGRGGIFSSWPVLGDIFPLQ